MTKIGSKKASLLESYGGQSLFIPVLSLLVLGIIFVYSASSVNAENIYKNEFYYVQRHLIFVGAGLVSAFVACLVPLKTLYKYAWILFVLASILTLSVMIPGIGRKINGARRWIQVLGIQFQPSELLKISVLLVASTTFAKSEKSLQSLLFIPLSLAALLLQPDFGNSFILFLTLFFLLFASGLKLRWVVALFSLAIPSIVSLLIFAPYRFKRLVSFLDPFSDPQGSGFQIIQSFVAIATGGFFGKGLGSSEQKLFYLPEAHTDFIFSVIAEEIGFVGVILVVSLFVLFFLRASSIVRETKDVRSRYLVLGILIQIFLSFTINIAMVGGLLPTKGLPLPFVSSGGTSLIACLFLVGLMANIQKSNTELEEGTFEHDIHK